MLCFVAATALSGELQLFLVSNEKTLFSLFHFPGAFS